MLRIADRHILKQIITPLAAAMSIGLLMLLAERMVRLLENTLGKKNSFAVVFELLAYLVPHYLGTAIPAALFLGLLLGFGRMSSNSETDAFMAAGIGLNRLARPVIVLAALLSLVSLAIFGWLQPYTRYAYRSVVFDVRNVDCDPQSYGDLADPFGAAGRIETAGVADDLDPALDAGAEHLLHLGEEHRRKPELAVASPLLVQYQHRQFGQPVAGEHIDVAALDHLLRC